MYVTDETLSEALLNMHTAFIGKVVSVSGNLATVQPLNMMKQMGGDAKKRSVISDVPILHHVGHWRIYDQSLDVRDSYSGGGSISPSSHGGHVSFTPVGAGDIVFCICADRDISQTRKGKFATPALGHHEISNAVIVGLIT